MMGKTPNTIPSEIVHANRSGEMPRVNCASTGANSQRRHQTARAAGTLWPPVSITLVFR
jgi:hypothetical protein